MAGMVEEWDFSEDGNLYSYPLMWVYVGGPMNDRTVAWVGLEIGVGWYFDVSAKSQLGASFS